MRPVLPEWLEIIEGVFAIVGLFATMVACHFAWFVWNRGAYDRKRAARRRLSTTKGADK